MLLVVGTKVYKDQMLTEFPTLKLWKCVGINFPILCQWRMCCMVQLDGRNGESLSPYLQAALPYLGSEKLVRTVPLEALLQLKMAIGTWHTYNLWMQTEDPSSPTSCSPSRKPDAFEKLTSRVQKELSSSALASKNVCAVQFLNMEADCIVLCYRTCGHYTPDTVPHQRLLKKTNSWN